jgi:hypothetical protein
MGQSRRITAHPDENLLAAFAERTLGPGERVRVLEHLSDCSECRETVFLAQQAAGEAELQATLPRRSFLSRMYGPTRWRWAMAAGAGLLAAMLIAAPMLILRRAEHSAKTPTQSAALSETETTQAQMATAPAVSPAQTVIRAAPLEPASKAAELPRHRLRRSDEGVTASVQPAPAARFAAPVSPPPAAGAATSASGRPGQGAAEIAGSVVDSSGAAIPGAKVSLRLPDATTREATTDPAGRFQIGAVPPGNYKLEFNAAGFNAAAREIAVPRQERASLSETLVPGASSQTVEVSAAAPQLQTENAQLSATINGKAADSPLPLNGRNFSQLAGVVSGISTGPADLTMSIRDGVVQNCVGEACVPRGLPSRAPAVSVAFRAAKAMAVDADGNLFSTNDGGEHWLKATAQWQGKAVAVQLVPPPSRLAQQPPGASGSIGGPFPISAAPPPVFELSNDRGQVWLSSDEGKTWRLK